jgi:hypothetical protein
MIKRKVRRAVLFLMVVVFVVPVVGFVVMNLWNWLVPALFGGRLITFWQALGLLVLSRILFGGFLRGHRRVRMVDRWEQLTPEEREKIKRVVRSERVRSRIDEIEARERAQCGHRAGEPGTAV